MEPLLEVRNEVIDDYKRIKGDVIGDTAYSERFVLKILMKFANLDTINNEVQQSETFEEQLCILWNMTTEKDVVDFLHTHETLKLMYYALPAIKTERVIEIILGIIGNMCCNKVVVLALLDMDDLIKIIMGHMKGEDVRILIQVLRLINACLFLSEDENIKKWLNIFNENDYTQSLNFILQNSSNKELLTHALENFNTVCSQCNIEQNTFQFYTQFVKLETLNALVAAFTELTKGEGMMCVSEELDRIIAITLQILLYLIGFQCAQHIYQQKRKEIADIIKYIFNYFESFYITKRIINEELVDVVDAIATCITILELSLCNDINLFFTQTYIMWGRCTHIIKTEGITPRPKSLHSQTKSGPFIGELRVALANIMCTFMLCCNEDTLALALHKIGNDYDEIVESSDDHDMIKSLKIKMNKYRLKTDKKNEV